jgi:hypothetical protein
VKWNRAGSCRIHPRSINTNAETPKQQWIATTHTNNKTTDSLQKNDASSTIGAFPCVSQPNTIALDLGHESAYTTIIDIGITNIASNTNNAKVHDTSTRVSNTLVTALTEIAK